METLEGNKLIAVFMGMKIIDTLEDQDVWVKTDIHNGLMEETNTCFHHSWDWIMLPCKKFSIDIGDQCNEMGKQVYDKYIEHCECIEGTIITYKIEDVFKHLVEAILWYNTTLNQ